MGERLKKRTIRGISPALPASAMPDTESELKPKLRPSKISAESSVTLESLARKLRVPVSKLIPLLDFDYLEIYSRREPLEESLVGLPDPEGMDWLRGMLRPLPFRPLVPLTDVSKLLCRKLDNIRSICVQRKIPLLFDPAFGEVTTMTGFSVILHEIRVRKIARFDRQAMLVLLLHLGVGRKILRRKPAMLPFHERLDREIRIISKLKEPERTMRAADLWLAYSDAKTVAECLARYYGEPSLRMTGLVTQLDRRMDNLDQALQGKAVFGLRRAWGYRKLAERKKKRREEKLRLRSQPEP